MSIRWIDTVVSWSRARGAAYTVALILAERADEAGRCWPGLTDIARRARLGTERAASRAIKRLVELREVAVTSGGGRRRTNVYQLTLSAPNPETLTGAQGFLAVKTPARGAGVSQQADAETPARGARKPLRAAPENPDRRAGGTVNEPSPNQGAGSGARDDGKARSRALLVSAGVGAADELAGLPGVDLARVEAVLGYVQAAGSGIRNPAAFVASALRDGRTLPAVGDAGPEYAGNVGRAEQERDAQRRRAEESAAERELTDACEVLAEIPGGELDAVLERVRLGMFNRPKVVPENWRGIRAWVFAVVKLWRQSGGTSGTEAA